MRANPKLSGPKHNVFGIQTGVAISFLIKRHSATRGVKGGKGTKGEHACRIFYTRRTEFETAEEKLSWLSSARLRELSAEEVQPDAKHNWINLTHNDFEELLPIASKAVKAAKKPSQEKAIFKLFSLGVVTNRDDWLYDVSRESLEAKVHTFIDKYESERLRWRAEGCPAGISDWVSREIKWTSELESSLRRNVVLSFDVTRVRKAMYRPYSEAWTYFDRVITHRIYQQDSIFPIGKPESNKCVIVTDPSAMKPWLACSVDQLPDLHYVGAAAGAVCLPLQSVGIDGYQDNITDWALKQFKDRYKSGNSETDALSTPSSRRTPGPSASATAKALAPRLREDDEPKSGKLRARAITKQAIFHYVYAVLHDPVYREKYAQNLKREFPRIPFYGDFWQWAAWGEQLMALHLGYETLAPWPLTRTDIPDEKARLNGGAPKPMLKADKDVGRIALDSETTLAGIPPEAWTYKLGNRSALEWILDQYKEKKPKDPTIREKFNTYRFADYKEHVIDLLACVTRVSVGTQTIVAAMRVAAR
ncbi:MAG: type ISP restriction/modification enzyme [Rhodanobacter sp.]